MPDPSGAGSPARSYQRARNPEQKSARRDDLVAAARALAEQHTTRRVTLTQIGERARIHKSGVLRYFTNKESVLLVVASQEWRAWADDACCQRDPIDLLVEPLIKRPLLCDLIANMPLSLEHEASPAEVLRYKRDAMEAIDRVGHSLSTIGGAPSPAQGSYLASVVTLFAGAIWQIANPSPDVAAALGADRQLASACIDFETELRRFVATLLGPEAPGNPIAPSVVP
ncbi:TetR/AcrR family transcriptional regulator [Leifsonia sp. AG29]|uniref:TetR/AcrR family transcriptional regulator n=1 Tax=Leifsonia sp. AG29 TaxID=2598860 RepID=UPI00131B3301|nr:TetR family transcriptional regulator [Leifsonia sp. AG29]